MNRFARRAGAAATLAALALGAASATAPLADASVKSTGFKVPFHDEYQRGWLTFCNRNGKPVTSGILAMQPFVWKAISSAPAPAGYRSKTGRATLYAYQPIQYVDPGDWSGSELTAASAFTNPDHPVVQATKLDSPLLGFTRAYPAHWDGLVEIRMMWTAVDKEGLQTQYAAADIRVTATKWTLVEGGGGSCSQGKGVSMETIFLPKAGAHLSGKKATARASQSHGAGNSAGSVGGHSSGGSGTAGTGRLASADSSAGIGGGALAGIGLGALALVWAAIFGIARWRRRSSTSES
jgi:hypothetical protein